MTNLANIVLLRAPAGKADVLGAALKTLVGLTRQEAGCLVIELNQSTEDPNTWMVYERWRDSAAFDNHMQQPYTAQFLARVTELTSEPPELRPFHYRG